MGWDYMRWDVEMGDVDVHGIFMYEDVDVGFIF
jgi:hypothetical protein